VEPTLDTQIRRQAPPIVAATYKAHKKEIPRFGKKALDQVVLFSGVVGPNKVDFAVKSLVAWSVDDRLAPYVGALRDFHRRLPGEEANVYKGMMGRVVKFEPSLPPRNMTLSFQPSDYFNHVATNLSMECTPPGWTTTIRTAYEPGPRLKEFADSTCSNHLGLDALLITGDGQLVIPQRSLKVAVDRGMYSASASGAFEFKATSSYARRRASGASPELLYTPFDGISHELEEELAIGSDEIKVLFCMGLSRDLAWGGKPQMYFYCETPLLRGEIERRIQKGAARDATFENERRRYYQLMGLNRRDQKACLESIATDAKCTPRLRAAVYFLFTNKDTLTASGASMLT
jgi:hypothetical protein